MTQQIEQELWEEFENEIKKTKDVKIDFQLTAIESEGLKKFFQIFLTEKLPEGEINKVLEKNLAVYIVQNKIDLEPIKQAYIKQKWHPGGLLGWHKKVINGELKKFNVGELVNWCKENRPDLLDLFSDLKGLDENKILRRSDLKFPTKHLPHIDNVKAISQIFGNEYSHVFKMLTHHLVSGVLPNHLKIVRIGQIETDLRDHILLVYPSGQAKGNIKNLIIKLKRDLGQHAIPLTSFHEEQLVGRIVKRKDKVEDGHKKDGTLKYKIVEKWIKNEGHFASDELLMDECKPLLTERDKETSKNFFLIAMDKYGSNEIFKRLTENLYNEEEVLRYYPHFNSIFGTQPFKFPQECIALNGFLKRVTTDYIPPMDRGDEIFEKRLTSIKSLSKEYEDVLTYLFSLKDTKEVEWTFSEDFYGCFNNCYKHLRHAGLYNTRKKRNYTKLVEWQLQDRLLRKSCLIAIGKDKTTHVTGEHVQLAFVDVIEDFIIELEFVNDKIYGDLDYGSVWGTSDKKEEEVLSYLYQYGATSEESSTVTIKELQDEIKQIYKVRDDQARKIYYKLVSKELIKANQVGQHGSKVWLVELPKLESHEGGKGDNVDVKKFYFEMVDKVEGGKGIHGGNGGGS